MDLSANIKKKSTVTSFIVWNVDTVVPGLKCSAKSIFQEMLSKRIKVV